MWKEDLLDRPTPQTQQQAYKVPSSQRVLNEEKYCHVVVSQAFVAGVQTTTDQQNILVLWHMSHLPPASAKKSSSKLHSETSFYQYVLVDGKITSFDFVAFDVQIDMEDGEGDGDDGAAVHLVVVITKLNEVFKWSFVVSTSSWETMLSMEYHSLSNVPVSVIKLHPLGYLSVSMEKGKAIVRNEVLEKENVLTLDCAGSGSSKIGQLCYYPVRIQQTTAAATGRRRVQSDASMELHVLFILFEDGNIQGWLAEEDQLCLHIPPVSESTQDEACCLHVQTLASSSGMKSVLTTGYRGGSIKRFELSLMPQDDSTSMDIFLSYREISMLDLVKELRQRASSMKGRVGALGDGDEVAVKREMKAIPLTMRWALFRDEEDHVSTFLLVMTSDGLIIVDQSFRIVQVLPIQSLALGNVAQSAIVASSKPKVNVGAYVVALTALDRVLRSVSIQSSQLIHADSNASKEENSGKTKGRHPSVPRPTKTVSASNMNVAPTNTRLAKEISTSMADRNDVEEIELDFFCPPRAHSPPLSARDYDEDGVGNGAKRKSLLFSPPSFKDPADEKKAEARKAIPRGGWEAPLKNSKGQLVDQPVTFHTKIKSSGYGQVSNDPFQRRLEAKRKERTSRSNSAPRLRPSANGSTSNGTTAGRRNSALGQPSGAGVGGRIRTYPMDCAPMSSQLISWDYPDNVASSSAAASSNPIFHLAYSNDAMKLAVASQASVLLSMRLPRGASQREVTAYMGHNASIRQVSFSHSKLPEYCMMTSSVDGTARMWKSSRVESSAIVFSHYLHQCSTAMLPSTTTNPSTTSALSTTASAAATKKVSRNRPYGGEVSASQFFYQDKFILLSVKSSVLLYAYDADYAEAKKEDLTRFLHTGKYQLMHNWDFISSAHNVCAMAAMNHVQSPLVIASTSDKMLHILDANEGKTIRSMSHNHEKNLSYIALSAPSPHVPLARHLHNVFLTTAPDNAIMMWDLRQASCVLRYSQHVNRREAVQVNFSPCMRYFATGSEDRSARIYDITAGKEVQRLVGHKDVVSAVVFNPLFAQVATGSYDGTVKFYVDPTLPIYS